MGMQKKALNDKRLGPGPVDIEFVEAKNEGAEAK